MAKLVDAPENPPTPDGPPAEPEVIAEKGHYVVRVVTPFVDEFNGWHPTEDGPETPVTVTRAGVQVTKASADHLQAQAAQHGVELTIEKVGA